MLIEGVSRCPACRKIANYNYYYEHRAADTAVVNKFKTHCKRGHLLEGDNLAFDKVAGTGPQRFKRRCITCRRDGVRERAARKRSSRNSSL